MNNTLKNKFIAMVPNCFGHINDPVPDRSNDCTDTFREYIYIAKSPNIAYLVFVTVGGNPYCYTVNERYEITIIDDTIFPRPIRPVMYAGTIFEISSECLHVDIYDTVFYNGHDVSNQTYWVRSALSREFVLYEQGGHTVTDIASRGALLQSQTQVRLKTCNTYYRTVNTYDGHILDNNRVNLFRYLNTSEYGSTSNVWLCDTL